MHHCGEILGARLRLELEWTWWITKSTVETCTVDISQGVPSHEDGLKGIRHQEFYLGAAVDGNKEREKRFLMLIGLDVRLCFASYNRGDIVGTDVGGARSASYVDMLHLLAFTRELAIWESSTFSQFELGYSNDKFNVKYVGHS